jgi:pilus assembly protein Flp/PilA
MRAKIEQMKKKGQGLVEYALILVLIAIVVILILTFLGGQVNTTFSKIGSGLNGS